FFLFRRHNFGNSFRINPTLSYTFNDFNITVSGGYWFNGKGVRADISYPVYRTTDFLHSVSLTYGFVSLEENRTGSFWGYFAGKYEAGDRFTSNFTGFTYKLNWKSFYLQTGPMWGENA